jgi:hypothetical protein
VLLLLAPAGCGSTSAGGSAEPGPSVGEAEPNDTFPEAHKAIYTSGDVARLSGTIGDADDLDVYDLGPMAIGDSIVVDVNSETEGLDASIAVFDEGFRLVMDNDDEDLSAQLLDPYLQHVVRHEGESYFLVVGRSAFAGFSPVTGDYRVTVRVTEAQSVPAPKSQTVFLDFDGGEVGPNNLLVNQVRPFDAAAIDPAYSGQDDVIIQAIVDTMEENYEAFNVVVITDADELPPQGEYSTVMFGSYSGRAFGISESVDHYNGDDGDTAIIFTESFTPDQFTQAPSAEELGVAIGNIGSHEAGHLLGLNHVDDPTALMDAVSPADTFLADQDFKLADLSSDILPIGYQDAPLLLSESVGLMPGVTLSRQLAPSRPPAPRLRNADARYWCATCNRKLGD